MKKQLLPLALLAAIALGAVYILAVKESGIQAPISENLLFDDFAKNADKLLSIKLSNAQGEVFKATKGTGNWMAHPGTLSSPYPADQNALTEVVKAIVDGRIREQKTSKPEFFARLGLEDLHQTDSQATLLELSDGKKVWEVLIGNNASSGNGSFVRIPGENRTWLFDTIVPVPTDENAWLKQNILELDDSQVNRVERTDGQGWAIEKVTVETQNFQLENLPQGKNLKYESVLSGLVSNLTSLRFDTLMLADASELASVEAVAEIRITTFSGEVVKLSLSKLEDVHYLMVESDPVNEEKYWHNVVYNVSSFSAGQLTKVVGDFLEEDVVEQEESSSTTLDEGESPGE